MPDGPPGVHIRPLGGWEILKRTRRRRVRDIGIPRQVDLSRFSDPGFGRIVRRVTRLDNQAAAAFSESTSMGVGLA